MGNDIAKTNPRIGTVGGQAVLEGVMMKGKAEFAIAVRSASQRTNSSRYAKSIRYSVCR